MVLALAFVHILPETDNMYEDYNLSLDTKKAPVVTANVTTNTSSTTNTTRRILEARFLGEEAGNGYDHHLAFPLVNTLTVVGFVFMLIMD